MKKIFILILFYIFLFSIHFVFLPIRIRMVFAFFGIILLYKDYRKVISYRRCGKQWRSFFHGIIILICVIVLSSVFNSYFDATLIKYPVSILLSLTSAYFFVYLVERISGNILSKEDILRYTIVIGVIECFIAIFIFINPSLKDAAFSVVYYNELARDTIATDEGGVRLIGIGAQYFGGGIYMALCIVYCAFLSLEINERRKVLFLLLSSILLLIVGSAIARTTLVGLIMAVVYFVIGKGYYNKNKWLVAIFGAVFFVAAFNFYKVYLENNPLFEGTFQRAFSLVYSYKETGEMQSTSSMVGSYTTPKDMSTWIIGDAIMADPRNPATEYYQGIDIGVWRLVWGYGIIGLIIYSYVQYCMCRLAFSDKRQCLIIFIMYVLFMNKGLSPMDSFLSLFIMQPIYYYVYLKKDKE